MLHIAKASSGNNSTSNDAIKQALQIAATNKAARKRAIEKSGNASLIGSLRALEELERRNEVLKRKLADQKGKKNAPVKVVQDNTFHDWRIYGFATNTELGNLVTNVAQSERPKKPSPGEKSQVMTMSVACSTVPGRNELSLHLISDYVEEGTNVDATLTWDDIDVTSHSISALEGMWEFPASTKTDVIKRLKTHSTLNIDIHANNDVFSHEVSLKGSTRSINSILAGCL